MEYISECDRVARCRMCNLLNLFSILYYLYKTAGRPLADGLIVVRIQQAVINLTD